METAIQLRCLSAPYSDKIIEFDALPKLIRKSPATGPLLALYRPILINPELGVCHPKISSMPKNPKMEPPNNPQFPHVVISRSFGRGQFLGFARGSEEVRLFLLRPAQSIILHDILHSESRDMHLLSKNLADMTERVTSLCALLQAVLRQRALQARIRQTYRQFYWREMASFAVRIRALYVSCQKRYASLFPPKPEQPLLKVDEEPPEPKMQLAREFCRCVYQVLGGVAYEAQGLLS